MQFPDLTGILPAVPWAVVGAAAARMYMPERATYDLDILISAGDGPEAHRLFLAYGATFSGELSIGGSSWVLPDGFIVDVLEGQDAWCRRAVLEAQANRDAAGLPVLPLPYLVLMKFQAGRVQDLADITRMLGQASENQLEQIRSLFEAFEPDGLEDLQSMVELGRLELDGSS